LRPCPRNGLVLPPVTQTDEPSQTARTARRTSHVKRVQDQVALGQICMKTAANYVLATSDVGLHRPHWQWKVAEKVCTFSTTQKTWRPAYASPVMLPAAFS